MTAGCLYCETGCRWCQAPAATAVPMPAWFRGTGKGSATKRARVARGLHPHGFSLGPEATTCGTCAHFRRKGFHGRDYAKCSKVGDTNGPATDTAAAWRGCVAHERGGE